MAPLQESDLSGLCFGLGLSHEEKRQLAKVSGPHFPKEKFFDSHAKAVEFGIDFKPWISY
jgi:hypothetical protein